MFIRTLSVQLPHNLRILQLFYQQLSLSEPHIDFRCSYKKKGCSPIRHSQQLIFEKLKFYCSHATQVTWTCSIFLSNASTSIVALEVVTAKTLILIPKLISDVLSLFRTNEEIEATNVGLFLNAEKLCVMFFVHPGPQTVCQIPIPSCFPQQSSFFPK